MTENLRHVAIRTAGTASRQYTVIVLPVVLADHIAAGSPDVVAFYAGAVVLWLVGVVIVIMRKMRA